MYYHKITTLVSDRFTFGLHWPNIFAVSTRVRRNGSQIAALKQGPKKNYT